MCLATVYVENDGQQEKVMQDVAWIRTESRGLELITLLGESKRFQASIKSIDLVKGLIVLEMTIDHRGERVHRLSAGPSRRGSAAH